MVVLSGVLTLPSAIANPVVNIRAALEEVGTARSDRILELLVVPSNRTNEPVLLIGQFLHRPWIVNAALPTSIVWLVKA